MRDKLAKLIFDCWLAGTSDADGRAPTAAEYADHLIAHGVIVLPCPVGTTVYVVGQFLCDADGYGMNLSREWDVRVRAFTIDMMDKVGVSVFLDRKEAEAELERKMHER